MLEIYGSKLPKNKTKALTRLYSPLTQKFLAYNVHVQTSCKTNNLDHFLWLLQTNCINPS